MSNPQGEEGSAEEPEEEHERDEALSHGVHQANTVTGERECKENKRVPRQMGSIGQPSPVCYQVSGSMSGSMGQTAAQAAQWQSVLKVAQRIPVSQFFSGSHCIAHLYFITS